MVNSSQHRKGWKDAENSVSITTADGGQLITTKMGGTVSLLSFSPQKQQWERMIYKDCLLVPSLVTNLIGMKSVMHAQGKVTFEKEVITVQDKDGHVVGVPTSGDGYPAIAMMIWDDSMPEPAVSLAFMSRMVNATHSYGTCNKANLWHWILGHASHDAIMRTRTVTLSHDIPLNTTTKPETPCDICVRSKATAKNTAHPRRLGTPLELVSMDIMGPLHGNAKFVYVLIIHDAFSGMIWVWGLTSKKEASQEAAWWLSEMHVTTHKEPSEVIIDHRIKEVWVDQGELWSKVFRDLCSSMGVKIMASPTQHHTDNAFAEQAIQTVQKITRSLLYDSGMDERWWPHTIAQAVFIHNRLAGSTCGNVTPYELFYTERPELCHIRRFGCVAYVVLRGSTRSTWLQDHAVVSKHLHPCTLQGRYLGFSDAPLAIKGHKVWLPELDWVVVTRDVCFS